jgi:PAS domain S-box-containing protein
MEESAVLPAYLRVLLVEDNEDDYIIMRDVLEDIAPSRVEIEWVTTYEAARDALTKERPAAQGEYDVCLLDYNLGSYTGLELLQELVTAMPSGSLIPIIVVTGNEDPQVDAATAKAGASDYLIKNHINALLLERSIRYAIQRKAIEAALLQARQFAQATVDSLPDNIAVLDEQGVIVAVNSAWAAFEKDEETTGTSTGVGANYLAVCDASNLPENRAAAQGIREVMSGQRELFSQEYPCHSPKEKLWFEMRVKRFTSSGPAHVLVAHENITQRKLAEEALRHSNELLHAVTEGATDAIFAKDRDRRYLMINTTGARLMGYAVEEVLGKTDAELVPLEAAQRFDASDRRILTSGATETHEESVDMGGATHTFLSTKSPLHGPAGEVVGIVGISRDITDRKQHEEALRISTERFEILSRATNDAAYDWNLATGDFWWNEVFGTLFGYRPEQVEATIEYWESKIHPDDRKRVHNSLYQAIENGERSWFSEYRFQRGDGSYAEIFERGSIIFDADHRPLRMVGSLQDITQRKQAEAALLRMRDELEVRVRERTAALEQANAETRTRARQQEAVAVLGQQALKDIDLDTLLTGATALVSATLDVEISSILEVAADKDHLQIRAVTGGRVDVIGQRVPTGSHSQAGYLLGHNAPTIVTDLRTETRFTPSQQLLQQGVISGVVVIIGDSEKPFGLLGAYTTQPRHFTQDDVHFLQSMANVLAAALDLHKGEQEVRELNEQLKQSNEQLRIENAERQMGIAALRETSQILELAKAEAEAANAAKSEFLSRMSHELRTPLNAILGFGQILEMRLTSPWDQEPVGHILRGGEHLLGLINEVLDLSRIESGHLHVSLEPVALERLFHEVADLMTPVAARYNVHLEIADQGSEAPFVLADQQRLKQVLLNLLSNAIKYNRAGGHVSLVWSNVSLGRVRLEVRDDGPGIAPEDLPKLFMPFERLQAAHGPVEGTGLGLALCQGMVQAMDGRIGLESRLGEGTTAWVELPWASPTEVQHVVREEAAVLNSMNCERTVLLIEDNLANLRLMEHVLAEHPEIHLISAMQGHAGLEMAKKHRPVLILLDRGLPDLSGDEVLQCLQRDPSTASIPVIITSADATPSHIQRLKEAGAAAYLTKPININEFIRTVQSLLS